MTTPEEKPTEPAPPRRDIGASPGAAAEPPPPTGGDDFARHVQAYRDRTRRPDAAVVLSGVARTSAKGGVGQLHQVGDLSGSLGCSVRGARQGTAHSPLPLAIIR